MKLDITLSPGDAARVLGVTTDYLRRLDDELQPDRLPNGRRAYRVAAVEKFASARAAKRKAAR